MKRALTCAAVMCLSLAACASDNVTTAEPAQTQDVLRYVDPMIGTGGHGHTFPGAVVPFGMVQLSPDNPSKGWDWTSGYHYSDDTLLGFSHTHLSGTGVGDMLDILVMPFRGDYDTRERDDKNRISTHYSHDDEDARAGYYRLDLPAEQVRAELTATTRAGVHRYTFNGEDDAKLLFDLGYAQNYDEPVMTFFRIDDAYTLSGYRVSTGWAKLQPMYFTARFSQPFAHTLYKGKDAVSGDTLTAKDSKVVLNFGDIDNTPLQVNVGLSYTSIANARANLDDEVGSHSFSDVRQQAQQAWQTQLGKFAVSDNNETAKTKFFTALYHAFIAPQHVSDSNGDFFGADGAVHSGKDYQRYSLFSLWDTFRALHPLLTVTNPEQVDDMVDSMMGFHEETGLLPTWDLMSNETDVMIGYHAVPVIVDAYLKGLTDVSGEALLNASLDSAQQPRFGIDLFSEYGYVPSDLEVEAVSKTLEYAFDDAAIAQLAGKIGNQKVAERFEQRAQSYKRLFDSGTGFMRGKTASGDWVSPFNPTFVEHRKTDYTEANAWQYTFFVPHDVEGLIALFGDTATFTDKLNTLFTTSSEMQGDVSPDISGLIGQYAHGNEPVHHVAYLYAYTDERWQGEDRIKTIRETMYRAQPDGLAGNDDVGQMSAWYVFSALGFYPLNPVGGEFVLGTPQFEEVAINVGENKTLTVKATPDTQGYVQRVTLNGRELDKTVSYDAIMKGGTLVFEMGSNKR
ncbi:GH92 family glycosyl hydrolase [Alteromonas halophila]|nr:GH92 family glycosyl hydrolase [Alteromonas halophila]